MRRGGIGEGKNEGRKVAANGSGAETRDEINGPVREQEREKNGGKKNRFWNNNTKEKKSRPMEWMSEERKERKSWNCMDIVRMVVNGRRMEKVVMDVQEIFSSHLF